ncbi:MAG: hypothetical protein DRR06_01030 [Gammaproteobacteria bacterium]|nr:MAG: hypothetical protein DRR06_01030 [Gammaproteobacteria bacterium]RLA54940.1 MAG: hypothetical protein DRR42_00105 [Gammaproteobacteria bacterium]
MLAPVIYPYLFSVQYFFEDASDNVDLQTMNKSVLIYAATAPTINKTTQWQIKLKTSPMLVALIKNIKYGAASENRKLALWQ